MGDSTQPTRRELLEEIETLRAEVERLDLVRISNQQSLRNWMTNYHELQARAEAAEQAIPATTLVGGERIVCHPPAACEGSMCCVHNPSEHHMREWPQHWRDDAQKMERTCPHGIGHPDPDDTSSDTTHGCDGCCAVDRGRS